MILTAKPPLAVSLYLVFISLPVSLIVFITLSKFFFCQLNFLLNYCWKAIVKSIIFSIITWSGLVERGFESSLDQSLDCECEGLSRVWTQAYNWPIWGSVSDPCLCLQWWNKSNSKLDKYCRTVLSTLHLTIFLKNCLSKEILAMWDCFQMVRTSLWA